MLQALRPARFLIALLVSSMPVVGYLHQANYYTFVVSFVVIPALDWLVGRDLVNEPPQDSRRRLRDAFYRAILYAYVPVQVALIVWGAALGLLAALPITLWRRYVRQMDEVHGARRAIAQDLRRLQGMLREAPADAVTARGPRR